VKVFLDENFPLALADRLKADGYEPEHVITIGWRGASDDRIRERLIDANLIFLTQDEDFLFSRGLAAIIVLSRVRQARPLRERIDIWRRAVRQLIQDPGAQRHFELMDDGGLVPWEEGPQSTWIAKAPRQPNASDDIMDN
jgi:hypothetical protein